VFWVRAIYVPEAGVPVSWVSLFSILVFEIPWLSENSRLTEPRYFVRLGFGFQGSGCMEERGSDFLGILILDVGLWGYLAD